MWGQPPSAVQSSKARQGFVGAERSGQAGEFTARSSGPECRGPLIERVGDDALVRPQGTLETARRTVPAIRGRLHSRSCPVRALPFAPARSSFRAR